MPRPTPPSGRTSSEEPRPNESEAHRRRVEAVFRAAFSTDDGAKALEILKEKLFTEPILVVGSPDATAFNAGRIHTIRDIIRLAESKAE